jgi:cytochrome c oxidase subunit 2
VFESAFDPAGIQASRIGDLWWFMFWTSSVIWVIVVGFVLFAVRRGRSSDRPLPERAGEQTMKRGVIIATALSVTVLVVTVVYSVATGSAMASLPSDNALRIKVTGHQWWWEFEYEDSVPAHTLVTANEIHVPVGEPIQLVGTSRDVIHSLWAPNLFGKKDMIPGKATAMWFRVDRPGTYRGQCAEFCGHQHAKMAVVIIAESREKFDTWYKQQLQPAAPPSDSLSAVGQTVFMSKGCPLCHTVGGTRALGTVGPPLTHIASQKTIAAGTLANTRGNMAGWIMDPQSIKPGVRMPPNDLSGPELQAILAYLEGLQ